jgi:hypothetical protein
LVFQWSHRIFAYSFHRSAVFSLNSLLFFKYLFCLWTLKFCLPLVLVCSHGFHLYILFVLRKFYFQCFCLILFSFLRLPISFLSSYFTFYLYRWIEAFI